MEYACFGGFPNVGENLLLAAGLAREVGMLGLAQQTVH